MIVIVAKDDKYLKKSRKILKLKNLQLNECNIQSFAFLNKLTTLESLGIGQLYRIFFNFSINRTN